MESVARDLASGFETMPILRDPSGSAAGWLAYLFKNIRLVTISTISERTG